MDPSSGRGFTIIGRVIERASGSGVAGARVEAWDKDLIFDDLVGSAITDVQGRFEIPFESRAFRELLMDRRPDLYFKVFLDGTLIASTENSVLWNVAQGDTDVTIEVETVAVLPQRFVVLGHVRQADGRPLVNAPVRAFDRDLRSEQTLGEARTNAQGRYRITYGPDRFLRAEKRTADLQVRVYDAQDLVRAESSVHFNAAPRQTVNLLLGGGEFQGLSEYEQLVEEIAPLLEGLTLAQLREDDAHQDISFLSGETGRDMRSLALLARAGRAEAQTGIEAEVFFGLFRKGLPLGLPALIAAGVQAQRKALGDAVDESIISLRIASQIESIVEQLTRLVVWHALQPPADPSRANLAGLAATVLPDSAREAFIAAYAEHSGSVFEFWEQLAAQPEFTEHIQGLQLACQLGALTRSHLPLVRFLQQAMGDGVLSTGLQTIPFHSLADLVGLDENGWQQLINLDTGQGIIGFPLDSPGDDDEQKAVNYARAMAGMVEDAFTSRFAVARLEQDELPGKEDLVAFLSVNPGFDLSRTPLAPYLREHPDALAGVEDAQATARRVEAMSRLYKLTPRYLGVSTLLKDGLDSAYRVARLAQNVFRERYGTMLGGSLAATRIHRKAQSIQATAVNLLAEYAPVFQRVGCSVVPDAPVRELDDIPDWSSLFGSVSLCACEHCRSVQGPAAYLVDLLHFLGDRPALAQGSSVKDVLFARRPDLGEVQLSCENTNTPVPYVDLVNEALEDAVAPPPPFLPFVLDPALEADLNACAVSDALREAFQPPLGNEARISVGAAGRPWPAGEPWWTIDELAFSYTVRKRGGDIEVLSRSRQTRGSAAERAANAQYVNAGAYLRLGNSVYPWSLPFDSWAEEVRSYLAHLQVPRHHIMETVLAGGQLELLSVAALACERLGLTASEARIVVGLTTSEPAAPRPGAWNLWGFDTEVLSAEHSIPDPADRARRITTGTWIEALAGRVDVFLQQTNLSYAQLLDLLDTYFVNPLMGAVRKLSLVSMDPRDPATCEISKLRLDGFDAADAVRTVRFVRLWRRLGWSMRDLDRAITALAPAHFGDLAPVDTSAVQQNYSFLAQLSHVVRVHEESRLPVLHLLCWWAPIDTAFYIDHALVGQPQAPSLYVQLFRNEAVVNPPDAAFTDDPHSLNGTLSEHAASIASALGVDTETFTRLLNDAHIVPGDPGDPGVPVTPDDSLSLDNLSRLFRHASLLKALKLDAPDYLSALQLIESEPFATTAATVVFMQSVRRVRDLGVSFAELDYLLRDCAPPGSGLAPTQAAIAMLLRELRDGMQQIGHENSFTGDPDEPSSEPVQDLLRRKLPLLAWGETQVESVMATLSGSIAYEVPLETLPPGLALPNASGGYEVTLAELPAAFRFPSLLVGHVTHDPVGGVLTAWRALNEAERKLLRDAAAQAADATLLAALEDLFHLQDALEGEITYDQAMATLCFSGPMGIVRRDHLVGASANTEYRTAIDTLFEAPRRFITRQMCTFSIPDLSVALESLPSGVLLPSAMRDRIYFDVAGNPPALHFLGAMTEQERNTLLALSTDPADAHHEAYRTAVESLYLQPDERIPDESDAFMTAQDAAAMFDAPLMPQSRFLRVLRRLLPNLRSTLSERFVVQTFSEALGLEPQAARALLCDWLYSPVDRESDPARRRRVIAEFLPRIYAVALEAIPAGVEFPPQLADALSYDADRRVLRATRFLSQPERALLRGLSDGPAFIVAVDALLALQDEDPGFAYSNPNVPPTVEAFPRPFAAFVLLDKVARLYRGFDLTPTRLGWLFQFGASASWLDLNALPIGAGAPSASFDAWLRIADLFHLAGTLPGGDECLSELFEIARIPVQPPPSPHKRAIIQRLLERLADWTGWSIDDLNFLVGEQGLDLHMPEAFRDERGLLRLCAFFTLRRRLAMSPRLCRALADEEVTQSLARSVIQAVRSRYEESQWLTLARPLRDVLRERQRSALVDFLVAHSDLPDRVRSANDLYAHFLMDVEMTPCMMTSRIKQAVSSVQLFVQRGIMSLEPEVSMNASADLRWREWQWMKSYRVWEANRRIFLYPENWLEPELRDDKSPFFRELESELLQSDLSADTARDAFHNYLAKLDQVSRLQIAGTCHELEHDKHGNVQVDILHVFGRTPGTPHVYFHRQRVDGAYWGAWQRIDLDVQGEHLLPVVWNRRLCLFWPVFTEKAAAAKVTMPGEGDAFREPRKYWEIQIAWSERQGNGWTGKRESTLRYTVDQQLAEGVMTAGEAIEYIDLTDPSKLFFRTHIDLNTNALRILPLIERYEQLYLHRSRKGGWNAFSFDALPGEPMSAWLWLDASLVQVPAGMQPHGMFLRERASSPLFLPAVTDTEALARTPGSFEILLNANGVSITEDDEAGFPSSHVIPSPASLRFGAQPFFYSDDRRRFLVSPRRHWTRIWDWPTAEIDPGDVPEYSGDYYDPSASIGVVGETLEAVDPMLFEPSFPVWEERYPWWEDAYLEGPGDPGGWFDMDWGGAWHARPLSARPAAAAPGGGPARHTKRVGMSHWIGDLLELDSVGPAHLARYRMAYRYRFDSFYHPYVGAFVRELNRDGVDGLLQRRIQTHPELFLPRAPGSDAPQPLDFATQYGPEDVPAPIVTEPYPREVVDFDARGSYSAYNWELFFHAPLLVADRLSKNQRFEEAQKWLHYIFDPTDASSEPAPQRYWRTRKFHEMTREDYRKDRLSHILGLLAAGGDRQLRAQLEPEALLELEELEAAVAQWRKHPFSPHVVARLRTTAYQKSVVMKYIDNLIAWGDRLFRRDTIESINEATQLYVLAAEILGPRPESVPPRATSSAHTYNSLEPDLGAFSNALVQIEAFISPSAQESAVDPSLESGVTLPGMSYFCIPGNDELLGYWDTVADRLFKIRHCMNIEGVVRQLPLFEPPIEPGLLAKAAAAGVDISSALNDVGASLPHYRFRVLAQKASELCAQLETLGAALLGALEKRDAEDLALLRAGQEHSVLELIEQVKEQQHDEARENETALHKSRDAAVGRYLHFQKLLGVDSPQVPAVGEPVTEQSPSAHAAIEQEAGVRMIAHEREEREQLAQSNRQQGRASDWELAASIAHIVPSFQITPWGVGANFGGPNIGSGLSAFANRAHSDSAQHTHEAGLASRLGQMVLRAHDWLLQNNMAAREIMQIDKQIAAAEIRTQMAERELENHRRQIENAKQVEQFLHDKYTSKELYGWMIGQISGVYFQAYQLAYDVAKRAEQAYRHELGIWDSSFVQFGYWDSLKKGLLAGEKLRHDLKRMEIAYLDQNRRDYEITRHISLAQLDPTAFVALRQSGKCLVSLPEALFDLDHPGHYLRRIKSVSVTIPCVTGPYTSVSCTLTLLKSSVRNSGALLAGKHARQEVDPRFSGSSGAIQSVVTSSAQDDSGLFELRLDDDRFLPFEGAGAVSEWSVELPADFRAFDYDTISDVILHVRYTAREGGGMLKAQAVTELRDVINQIASAEGPGGLARLFSLRHEYSSLWHRFLNPPAGAEGDQSLTLPITVERFPIIFRDKNINLGTLELFVKVHPNHAATHDESTLKLALQAGPEPSSEPLALSRWNGLLRASAAADTPPGEWTLSAWLDTGDGVHGRVDPGALVDVLLICRYDCS